MAFVIIAHYRAQPGTEQQVRAALKQMVVPTRAEPGNLSYEICADPADPAVFALFEKYVDAGAFTAHTETRTSRGICVAKSSPTSPTASATTNRPRVTRACR